MRGTKGAWHRVSHPLSVLLELVVDGVNRCTKGVPAWRQQGQAEGHCWQQITHNCTKKLREIGTYLPLRLAWYLRPFFFGQGAKNTTEMPRSNFSKHRFSCCSVLEKEPPLKLQESRVLASPCCQIHLVPDPPFSAKIGQENTAPED